MDAQYSSDIEKIRQISSIAGIPSILTASRIEGYNPVLREEALERITTVRGLSHMMRFMRVQRIITRYPLHGVLCLLGIGACLLGDVKSWSLEAGPPVSREEIQHFFISDEGNSTRHHLWMNRYLQKKVQWRGTVYGINRYPNSSRVEFLLKVLPDSLLYDTVAILEGDTMVDAFIQKGSAVIVEGTIVSGADAMGVKEVQVRLNSPSQIQLNADHPVNFFLY